MDFLFAKSPSRAKSPSPKQPSSRFRRQPPPELDLQPKLTTSASSSNLLSAKSVENVPAASASTSNLRAPSPSPERDKDPKRDKSKRLGMLAHPIAFHLPSRAKSPKPSQPRFSKSSIPDPPTTPRSASSQANNTSEQTADANAPIPPTPSTASVSSASTSTTNLAAPSVPARSPLRGAPRSVASFSSLLHGYSAPDSAIGLGLGLVTGVGASPGWSQLSPLPPSPSVYSPVHSIFPGQDQRRASAEEHRVRRSTSMRLRSASGDGTHLDGNGTPNPRSKRVGDLRMPSSRARSQSISSPILYEDGQSDAATARPDMSSRTTSTDRTISPPPRNTISPRPSTSRRHTTTNPPNPPLPVRDSGVAVDKEVPPPVPPKLHLRVQSDFTLGPEFGITPGSESGESSGFETAASHTAQPRPGTSNSTQPGMLIHLPTPTAESASTQTSAASQVSLLLESPSRGSKVQPDEADPRPSTSSLVPPRSVSGASTPGSVSAPPKTAKRTHALLELLSSERAYASDLALIRDIYLPLAKGLPSSFPLPPSTSSLAFQSTTSVSIPGPKLNGSKKPAGKNGVVSPPAVPAGSPDDPPMTSQDVKIIFGNIEALAGFADELSDKLEVALGNVVPGGTGEDCVGELFCELAPKMTPMYLGYITRHPAAVARYTALTTNPTPAMTQYLATTRAMTSSITHAWDLPSLIIKPLQRLLKYPLILQTILDDTPSSMGHKDRAALALAKGKMEEVARQVNEGRRRYEVVKTVLESGKSPPTGPKMPSVSRMKTFKGRQSAAGTEDLDRWEKRVRDGSAAATTMAERALMWADLLIDGSVKLLAWSKAFARVVDLDVVLGGDPQGGSEAVRAFTAVAQSLEDLSRELAAVIKEELLAQLKRLVVTTREPLLLLSHMHVLANTHHNLLNTPYSKSRPSTLQEASQSYVALTAQLRDELPRYVDMFERAFGMIVLRLSGWQARFFQEAERRWKEFWLALNVEESEVGAGESAAVETVRIWWSRWEATARQTATMAIVSPNRRMPRPSHQQQPTTPSSADSASWDHIPPPHRPYAQSGGSGQASALSLAEQSSRTSSNKGETHGHNRAISSEISPTVSRDRSGTSLAPRVQSDAVFPKAKKSGKSSNLRRMTDQLFGGTPNPDSPEPTRSSSRASGGANGGARASTHSGSSRMAHQPVLYAAAAIHPFDPETDATHLGLPFLTLRIGDTLEILVEAGHPSEHSNLPIHYDDAPDCMLAARSEDGTEGWALASYLMPLA
ncbi:RhoGEF domain protein [Ceratobasidium sp. AG-Ba]|nr:RhoGEF domain protein [Ceratobasidium sp. AG-Ba]